MRSLQRLIAGLSAWQICSLLCSHARAGRGNVWSLEDETSVCFANIFTRTFSFHCCCCQLVLWAQKSGFTGWSFSYEHGKFQKTEHEKWNFRKFVDRFRTVRVKLLWKRTLSLALKLTTQLLTSRARQREQSRRVWRNSLVRRWKIKWRTHTYLQTTQIKGIFDNKKEKRVVRRKRNNQ